MNHSPNRRRAIAAFTILVSRPCRMHQQNHRYPYRSNATRRDRHKPVDRSQHRSCAIPRTRRIRPQRMQHRRMQHPQNPRRNPPWSFLAAPVCKCV